MLDIFIFKYLLRKHIRMTDFYPLWMNKRVDGVCLFLLACAEIVSSVWSCQTVTSCMDHLSLFMQNNRCSFTFDHLNVLFNICVFISVVSLLCFIEVCCVGVCESQHLMMMSVSVRDSTRLCPSILGLWADLLWDAAVHSCSLNMSHIRRDTKNTSGLFSSLICVSSWIVMWN